MKFIKILILILVIAFNLLVINDGIYLINNMLTIPRLFNYYDLVSVILSVIAINISSFLMLFIVIKVGVIKNDR